MVITQSVKSLGSVGFLVEQVETGRTTGQTLPN